MTTLTEKFVALLSTRKATEKKCRQRRERRRRRDENKEKLTEFLDGLKHPQTAVASKTMINKNDVSDDQTATTFTGYEDNNISFSSIQQELEQEIQEQEIQEASSSYETAEVNVQDSSQPFVGKIQATTAAVRVQVPDHHEWYELY